MMRAPNEIDFWRGFALVTIFVNHIPGIYFERFTYRNVSLSDSAELFVFLAGCSLRILVDGAARALPAQWLVFRLEARAFNVYVAQMVVTEMAIALLAAAALLLDAPYLLDWHNASAVFNDPVKAHIGLVLLTHQLGYFNILPLYVVLLLIAPAVALLHRHAKPLLPLISFAIYAFGSDLRRRICRPGRSKEPGSSIRSPGSLFMSSASSSRARMGSAAVARRHRSVLRWLALPVVLLGALVAITDFSPDPVDVPEPKLLFTSSTRRFCHRRGSSIVSRLTAIFAGTFKMIDPWIPRSFGIFMPSRPQFADRLLRPVSSQPDGANTPLYFRRTCCIGCIDRYLGYSSYGFHRMGSGMARKIAGGIGKQAIFAAALFWLLMASPHAEDVEPAARARRR